MQHPGHKHTRPLLDVEQLEGGFRPSPMPPGFVPPPTGLPTTQTIEAYDGPWRNAGAYGRLVTAEYPATANATPLSIFNIDTQLGPPRPRTLHFFRSDAEIVPDPTANADIYAQITYGVGGVQNVFLLDWLRGGQVCLVCDSLRVEAVPYAPVDTFAYSAPAGTQTLGCMLSHEGSAPPRPPSLTTTRKTTRGGDELDFIVPDFARYVYPLGAATPADEVWFRNLNGLILKTVPVSADFILSGTAIPGGTTVVTYHSNAGENAAGFLFQLGL